MHTLDARSLLQPGTAAVSLLPYNYAAIVPRIARKNLASSTQTPPRIESRRPGDAS